MKKIIIFLFAILSFNLCVAFADIETSENPTNIGIGTNSTENALSIRGTMALGSSTYTSRTAPANGLIVEGNVGIGTFETTYKLDVDGPARLGGNGNLAFTNSIILNAAVSNILAITGGNVGINSTNPGKTLDVLGTGRFSSSLSASSLTATGLTAGQCVQTSTGGLFTTTGSACGSGGSITIGTTSPMTGAGTGSSFTLGVDESKLTLSNLGGSVTDGQVPNNITVDLSATATALAANPVNCAAGNYPLGVDASGTVEDCTPISSGSVGIGTANTITFWPTTTTIGSLPTATYPSLTELSYVKGATSSLQSQIDGLSVGSGGWTDGGTNVFPTATTDNVGIGTTTPSTTLEIVKQSSQHPLMVSSTATGDGDYLIVRSSGNVGIGTTIPIHFLAIRAATGSSLGITNTSSSSSSAGAGIQSISDDNAPVVLGDRLAFYTFGGSADTGDTIANGGAITGYADGTWSSTSAPTEVRIEVAPSGSTTRAVALVADSTSNVGIGTTTPQTKLQVVGAVTATSFSGDGSALTGISAGGWVDGGTNIYASPTTDNVAIGTTTPTQKLTVVGTVSATSFVGDGSALTGIGAGGWVDGGTNVYVSPTTDNVGIGTTTPSTNFKADIRGNLYVSGNVGIGTLLPRGTLDLGPTGTIYTQTITGPTGPTILGTSNNVGIGTITAGSLLTVGSTGQAAITSAGVATLPTPNLTGKIDINNVAVDDDDCTGEQGKFWYDSTDSAFEFCRDNSGTPERLGHPSPPASQTITAGATITADACGTFKDISSAGAVTTDTTNTFTAPSSDLSGCCMNVVNTGANNITLDNNSLFYSAGGADVVLGLADSAIVCTNGTVWAQMGGSNN